MFIGEPERPATVGHGLPGLMVVHITYEVPGAAGQRTAEYNAVRVSVIETSIL